MKAEDIANVEGDMGDEYQCAMCNGIFKKPEGSDKRAAEETTKQWGADLKPEDAVALCDPCYWAFMKEFHGVDGNA